MYRLESVLFLCTVQDSDAHYCDVYVLDFSFGFCFVLLRCYVTVLKTVPIPV